jgi:glycerol-3-phosphate dehydrogenase
MADERNPDVVVVGGAAGAVIAHKLAECGKRVASLWRDDIRGATDTHQKWLHSGLLYPSQELAVKVWRNRNEDWEIKKRYLEGPEQACILALNSDTVSRRMGMWKSWTDKKHEIPKPTPLSRGEEKRLRDEEITFAGGWATRDCVIDFPGMVHDLRRHLEGQSEGMNHLPALKEKGHLIMKGAKVLKLLGTENRVTGVAGVDWEGEQFTLSCQQCVVAAGAWSYELLSGIGVRLPLIIKKCLVLEIPKKLPVSKITVCLDVGKEDGTYGDVTLVPYKGKTLAAGTDFKVVYDPGERKLKELTCGEFEVAALKAELKQCFARAGQLTKDDYIVKTCFKTEQYNPEHPDVDFKVYTDVGGVNGIGHGVTGLIVALPGKASLMFDLARAVADVVP